MHQVIYYSRGGNTKKVADAIAGELGTKATDVKVAVVDPEVDVIFLGSGCYGGKPGEDWTKFVETHDFGGRKVALFSTSGFGAGKEIEAMTEALKKRGAIVRGSHSSRGKAFVISRGHPNTEDLAGARKFARETVKNG